MAGKLIATVGLLAVVGAVQCAGPTSQAPGDGAGRLTPTEALGRGRPQPPLPTVSIAMPDGTTLQAEVARSEEERMVGMMFRTELKSGAGMLFVFDRPTRQSFWMKNTLIPLDLVWLDERGRVVFWRERVSPCRADPCPSYGTMHAARFTLELKAGEIARRGLRSGQRLRFDLSGLPPAPKRGR